ncbi:MAG: TatD family hydrolase [Patescibacteria group bacterium]
MKFIDIHAHVQFAAYDADRDEVVARAREAGVGMINVGTQQDTSKTAVELAHAYPDIAWATVALHPVHTSKSYHDKKEIGEGGEEFTSRGEVFDYDFYKKLGADPKVIGIGECGLDYYRLTDETKAKQQETFIKHIELANELKKPLMLHIRQAYEDALDILQKHAKIRGDVHFFAGEWITAKKFLDLGFTLSFTGVITFTHDYNEVVKNTPLDMILAETDSPYITPEPLRGKRNEPANVKYVVQRIAELKNLPLEEVEKAVVANAKRVFNI